MMERRKMTEHSVTFAERNFAGANLGDERRSRRLPMLVNEMMRHPGGSLPQKLPRAQDLEAFYRLCDAPEVTHEAVMAPHRDQTLQYLQDCDHWALVIHDGTELNYTSRRSLTEQLGQIGNGRQRGFLAQNSLVVDPGRGVIVGLVGQILHLRPQVKPRETQAQKRRRDSRESRLWGRGTEGLPSRREIVDVCDRGADNFEFLEAESNSGRTFVIRSTQNRAITIGHSPDGDSTRLHTLARSLPAIGTSEAYIEQKQIVRPGKRKGKKLSRWIRTRRTARLNVAAAAILIHPPRNRSGRHGNEPLKLWVIRIWEPTTPDGEKPVEWILITNHPIQHPDDALLVKSWYEWRWTIEELHKAMKTGCGIECLLFQHVDRLKPAIGILSILALTLLMLRDPTRGQSPPRPAREQFADDYIQVLARWHHGKERPDWTVSEFCMALAKLGGHPGRPSSAPPGWIVLWRGWEKLNNLVEGASLAKIKCFRTQ